MARSQTIPARTRRAGVTVGEHLTTWRKLVGLTTDQLADRAGISRSTLYRLERGDTTVSLATLLNVARALGQLDRLVEVLDPYESDLGRARADQQLPQRVRTRSRP